jgi:hypothetical protein
MPLIFPFRDHPLHPAYVAKNEAATVWMAEKRNATAAAAEGPYRVGLNFSVSRPSESAAASERNGSIIGSFCHGGRFCHSAVGPKVKPFCEVNHRS